MSRFRIVRSGAGILCAAMLVTAAAHAQSDNKPSANGDDHKGRMEGRFKRMEKEIGITPEQEKKLEEHRKAHWKQSHELFEQMKQKRDALEAEMEKPDVNMDQVKSLHNDLKNIQDKLADQRLDGIMEVRKILTPEQFKKFHEMTKKEWGHDEKGQGRRMDKGPGHKHDGDMKPGSDDAPPTK